MILRIYYLCKLYILENLRRQAHLVTLFMAFGLLMLPAYVNAFSLGLTAFERVAKDFGLTIINYYAIAMAVFLGVTAVPADAERRTLYPLLARPIPRWAYLLGKFLGIMALIVSGVLILTSCLAVGIASLSKVVDWRLFVIALFYALEASVVAAASILFSTFASPALAGVMAVFLYVVGGLSNAFIHFFLEQDRADMFTSGLARGLKIVLPHFEVFRIKNAVVHAQPLSATYAGSVMLYGVAWMVFFLLLADIVFERKDL